jgi:L,D-transpeptidase YcbB
LVARPSQAPARLPLTRSLCRIFCCVLALALLPVCAWATALPPPARELCRLPLLEEALIRYRQLAEQGGWPRVPAGPVLREGDRDERIPALRGRLAASADLTEPGEEPELFDGTLKKAVQRFQRRHGLKADGLIGRHTLRELNVPVGQRIRQLVVNRKRCQALPPLLERRHILVNIADFTLNLYEDGELLLSRPVIVGRTYRQTPAFNSRITALVLNPGWNVPHSIATRDLLPEIRKNPATLAQMGLRVLRDWKTGVEIDPAAIDWPSLSPERFPYRLHQDPGPANALGRVKFFLPNAYGVYLHDTPARELFRPATRTFSSGCIRLARPLELAVYLLQGTPLASLDALSAEIAGGKTQTLAIPSPVAIYIVYLTAWVDPEGSIQFRRDVYRRDSVR